MKAATEPWRPYYWSRCIILALNCYIGTVCVFCRQFFSIRHAIDVTEIWNGLCILQHFSWDSATRRGTHSVVTLLSTGFSIFVQFFKFYPAVLCILWIQVHYLASETFISRFQTSLPNFNLTEIRNGFSFYSILFGKVKLEWLFIV